MAKKESIVLGSGNIYIKEYSGELPEIDAICVEENRLGHVSGGATLTYEPSYYEAKDDMGRVKKSIITEEKATLKSGIITFSAATLNRLVDTGRVTEDSSKKRRTIKIGGISNATNKSYAICFHHPDKVDGDVWVEVVGRNQAGFELSFTKDKETVIDAEFTCEPSDAEGTLINYVEADATIGA